MPKDSFITVLLVLGGGFSLIAAILNWNWFFENRKAQTFVKLFGRTGARIFYGALGIFIILVGLGILRNA